jgi:osmotically-inducible protein OsmY
VRWGRNSEDYTIKTAQDLRNRAEGLWHELSSPPNPDVDDQTLLSRVRSSFGRKTRHARSIQTIIENGVVTLRGDILSDEVEDVVQCIKSVAGVKRVINLLTVHQKAENIPNLQGEGPEYLQ